MSPASKRSAFLILAVTALVYSRALFFFFNDPEGTNLLVTVGTATIVYLASLTAYAAGSPAHDPRRFWLAILIQLLLLISFYFLGK
jgi:hypothetical protein